MAGEWIKVRTNLWDDPRVCSIVEATKTSEAAVVGGLYWLWATADEHSTGDGILHGMSIFAINRKTGIAGFGEAMVAVDWLNDHPEGVRLARFDEHNGESAKTRAQTAKRVANHKANAKVTPEALPEKHNSVTSALPREDKIREEIELKTEAKSNTKAASKSRKPTKTGLPEDFCLSAAVIAWADQAGHQNLQAHFDSFVRKAKANGYMYVDWDQALQNAVADDWAKLRTPQARGSPSGGYQTPNEKAKAWADKLTGANRNEQQPTIIDINAAPGGLG